MIFQKFNNFNIECRIISRDLVCSKFTTTKRCCKLASHFRLYNTPCSDAVVSPFIKNAPLVVQKASSVCTYHTCTSSFTRTFLLPTSQVSSILYLINSMHENFPEFRNFADLRGHSRGNPRSGLIFMGEGVPYCVC